jgi:hypothetical protein
MNDGGRTLPTTTMPPRPVAIDRVLDHPDLVGRLIRDNGPYTHVLMLPEFGRTASESGGGMPAGYERFCQRIGDEYFINPVFRGNWAYDRPLLIMSSPCCTTSGSSTRPRPCSGARGAAADRLRQPHRTHGSEPEAHRRTCVPGCGSDGVPGLGGQRHAGLRPVPPVASAIGHRRRLVLRGY